MGYAERHRVTELGPFHIGSKSVIQDGVLVDEMAPHIDLILRCMDEGF